MDLNSTKADFRISHKIKSSSDSSAGEKRYDKSVGTIYSGMLSIFMEAIFCYLFIYGVVEMLSGK